MIDTKPLEIQHPPRSKLRLNRSGQIDWALDPQVLQSVLEDFEVDGDDARHLDGAAKGDFAVALGEVQVADGEFGAADVDGQVDFGATREVLDVAVSAVFGAAGDCAGAFGADFGFEGLGGGAGVDVEGLWAGILVASFEGEGWERGFANGEPWEGLVC